MVGNKRIPDDFLKRLAAATDIVALIDERVPLKKSGSNYMARCPFHSEKSPSFSVSPARQTFHCFGCGASGDAIGWAMDYDRMEFLEAVEYLAGRAAMEVPRVAAAQTPQGEIDMAALYEANEHAARFYSTALRGAPEAVDYLKSRGVTGETAKRFRLGFAPGGWRNLPADWPSPILEAAGLTVAGESGGHYDRFRSRVMFPIRDVRGRVAGFGGRVTGDDKPKYLNTGETPAFAKGRLVYGLFEALQADRNPPYLLVVEGNLDVVIAAQAGYPAVATLGTSISQDQVALMFRYAKRLVFAFDGDLAGKKAAWRALEACLPEMRDGRRVDFALLPEGEDPDSIIRSRGPEAMASVIDGANPLSEFLFDYLAELHGTGSMESMAAIIGTAKPLIGKIPYPTLKDMMLEKSNSMAGFHSNKRSFSPKIANWSVYRG